jgi:hypothetical protein
MKISEMMHTKFEEKGDEITLRNDFASTKEYKNMDTQDNTLRLYSSQWPDGFTFQIRTFSPITDSGKPRYMVATTLLNLDDIKAMLAYAEKQAKRHDQI